MTAEGFVLTLVIAGFMLFAIWEGLRHRNDDAQYDKEAHQRFMAEIEREANRDDS